jgi:two-component system phosphate regulon sensor histidine kinase PhoR
VRLTLLTRDGLVLADSETDPSAMGDHSDRPEVVAALGGVVGFDTRVSATTGVEQRYLALPPAEGLMVRVSTPTSGIEEGLARTRGVIIRVSLVTALVAIGAVILLVRWMLRPIAIFADQAQSLARGHLDIDPPRSSVAELDRLGTSLSDIARDLGGRVTEAEMASATLQFVLGALPQGTVLVDGEDRIVYSNPAATQILGDAPATLSGVAPLQLQSAVREARETGGQVVRVIDHGRPARRLRGAATPFHDDDRVLLVIVDVTELERVDSVRRDFVANASHELKTPVATIIAASEAMQIALSRGDASALGFATQIDRAAQQLDRLVADLLDLSRLEQEASELRPSRLDEIVGDEIERVRDRFADGGLRLQAELAEAPVLANERDLGIATRNLLDNAVRHTGRGGTVSVSVGVSNGHAALEVADTGEGIPTRDLDRVFERFYRVDSARSRVTGGTGLGLAIVRHVAEAHGGEVTVTSELGRGSVFTVRLPLLVNQANDQYHEGN